MMKKIRTKKYTLPSWKAYLLINLFNADGGDGYSDKEVLEANQFIHDNKLASLIDVKDTGDCQIECTFILMNRKKRDSLKHKTIPA